MSYILNGLLEARQVKKKREHIQRRLVFEEPVFGLSLKTISENRTVKRTDVQTDDSANIGDIEEIKEFESERLKRAGYKKISDINTRSTRLLNREVNLPWNALNELKNIADDFADDTIPFAIDENVLERKSRDEATENLLNSKLWKSMLMYEIGLTRWCEYRLREEAKKDGNESKKHLIEILIEDSYRPDRHTRLIADFIGVSEQYTKDVISGRAEYGLSNTERNRILNRDDNKCRNCEETKELEVHHIIPVNQGGTKSDDNLCTLCSDCHKNIAHGQTMADVSYKGKEEFWEIVDEEN